MSPQATGLLQEQSAPVTIITSTDRSGLVLIAIALGLAFALVSLLIRVYVRREFSHQFARDDFVVAIAMVLLYQVNGHDLQLTMFRYSRCFNPVPHLSQDRRVWARLSRKYPFHRARGFAKGTRKSSGIDEVRHGLTEQISYASDILYVVTLWLTKCSVAFLFLRLSPINRHTLASKVVLLVATVFTFVSIFLVALRCDLAHPWIFINEQCKNLVRPFRSSSHPY